jgi:dTDP-4-amino-4,6-dideoxygalactose transaminase
MRDWGAGEKYNHTVWGGNFRLESLQAVFLRIKLRELKSWTLERQRIADTYRQRLNPDYLMKPIGQESSHVYHIFSVKVSNRTEFCAHLSQNQIGFGFHYPRAIHEQPAYMGRVLAPISLANAEYLAKTTVSLPIFPGQSDFEIDKVVEFATDGFVRKRH